MYNTIDIKIAKSNNLIKLSKRIYITSAYSLVDSDLKGTVMTTWVNIQVIHPWVQANGTRKTLALEASHASNYVGETRVPLFYVSSVVQVMGTYTLVASATREGFTSSREFMLSECITLVDIIMWQSCCCCRYISSGNISLLYIFRDTAISITFYAPGRAEDKIR